jgi:hypothetical protein
VGYTGQNSKKLLDRILLPLLTVCSALLQNPLTFPLVSCRIRGPYF